MYRYVDSRRAGWWSTTPTCSHRPRPTCCRARSLRTLGGGPPSLHPPSADSKSGRELRPRDLGLTSRPSCIRFFFEFTHTQTHIIYANRLQTIYHSQVFTIIILIILWPTSRMLFVKHAITCQYTQIIYLMYMYKQHPNYQSPL